MQDGHAQLSNHEMKSVSISLSTQISGLRLGNCTELNIGFSALETLVATLKYRKVWAKWVPQEHKEHYASLSGPIEPIQG